MTEPQAAMEIIPAVDVLEGRVVRLLRGDFDAVTEYATDPVAVARSWIEQGAALVHLVDLEGARSGRPDPQLWRGMAEAGIPFQVGGGLRSPEIVQSALEAGAQRAILGTATLEDPTVLHDLAARFGAERVAAAVDVSQGRAHGGGWQDNGRELDGILESLSGAGWLFVTSIQRDGTLEGPDLQLFERVAASVPGMRVGVAGGIGSLDHVRAAAGAGANAVIIGRALYDGVFTLAEATMAAGQR